MTNSFRMFRARGQPGCWFGYAEIDGVTYKIDAKHVGERQNKHFEGTVKRHLKADQQQLLPAGEPKPKGPYRSGASSPVPAPRGAGPCGTAPDFDDDLPF